MNGETGDCNTPVRRSSRARKPNSRFADDELDGCFKKIVTGVATPESSTGSSLVATPTRQKKGGKKRESESEEVDDNTSGSKETTPTFNVVGVVAGSQTKQDDIVNGLVNESEALADNMGKAKSSQDKPQERRTRSNAKKDPLESLPNEERKRGGKKGAKVKGKGTEEGKATTKSDSEGEKVTTNENLSEFEKKQPHFDPGEEIDSQAEASKITSLQVDEHRESTNLNDPLTVSKDKKKGKPVEDLDTAPVKEKVISVEDDRGKVTPGVKKVDVSQGTEILDSKSSSRNRRTSGKTKQHAASSDENVTKDPSNFADQSSSSVVYEGLEGIRPLNYQVNVKAKGVEKTALIKESDVSQEGNSGDNFDLKTSESSIRGGEESSSSHHKTPTSEQKESLEPIVVSSSHDALKEDIESSGHLYSEGRESSTGLFESKEKVVDDQEPGPREDLGTSPLSTKARGKNSSSGDRYSPGKLAGSSGLARGVASKGKGNVDFSEAETSTPARHRESSDASEAGASTPTRRRAHSISSEAEASTPTRQKGHSESSGSAVASPLQPKGHSELAADILPQPEGPSHLLGSEPPSPAKRRGRSSKQPLKESVEDEEKNKAKVSLIKSAKKSRSGERKSGQNTADIDISLEEQGSKEFDQSLSNVQSSEVDDSKESQNLDQTQEKGDPEVHNSRNTEKDDDSVDFKGEDNVVVKGKRSRSERLSEDGKGGQPVTEHQGSPKLKKRRSDVTGGTESSPEGDQKRKRQDEPEEDHIKRKRKKDDEVGDSLLAVAAETASAEKVDGEDTIKTLSSRFEDGDDNSKMIEEGNNQEAKHSPSSKENKKSVEKKIDSSSPVKGDLIQPQIAEEESTDVEDRRQSSIGSILSFLKRPNVTKKVEDTPDRRGRGDRGSPESKRRDDRKGRAGDRDRKSSESTRRDERKWKTFGEELPDSKRNEDRLGSKERRSRERKSEGHYESQRRDSARNEAQTSSAEYGNRNVKEADVTSSYDLGDSTSMTWESMKDMTPVTPSSCGTSSKKRKESKMVIEPDCSSKAGESEAKVDAGEEDDTGVEDRRTSSIGNILSFLKRGNQSGVQPKQSDSESSLEGSKLSHATNEDQIFSFVESTRKSTSESYYAKREDSDSSQKSKGSSKSRERRVSRWSAREETADSHGSQWEDAQMYQKSGSLSESRDRNRSKWSEQRNMEEPSFSKWEDMSSECQSQTLSSTKQERKDVALSAKNPGTTKPYSSWNDQGSTWKNWTGDQSHGAYETEHMENKFRETQKESKDSVSDDEHTDFGNREGLSEFMESYADELDQSTEGISANISQSHVYHDEIRQGSVNRGSTWHSKSEMELSPNQDMYMLPRGKELSSPPRERVWSPRSNEIVLSPKSRELMSSLRNMEVKLTPQMQELMSSQNKLDSVLPQELHHYPVKQDDNDGDSSSSFRRRKDGSNAYDIVSIPLPSESELPVSRKQRGSSSSSSQEGTWRSRDRYDRSRGRSRYDDVKNEHLKDEDTVKEEDHRDECFDDRSSFVEGIHDDKENLEPKVEDLEISEEEKLEHQRKIDRDLAAKDERSKMVVDQRMKSFFHLQENLYLGDRKKSKRSKEVRRMVCDCSLTKEETAYGEVGCGEDCLNRLLMIECGSRCPLKDRCTNKRFQSYEYAAVEVFNAEEKGCGIRARKEIPAGSFIMEYVGEVFDAREFKRRRKEYAKNHNAHFYFMALKGDLFIDATRKGNISRFINHSCDPNAQTQKWTVNGELRVGFFAQKTIEVDEEINFDYRLERYGREPQRCYCGTGICRGWLGESPDEKTKEEKEEEKRQERDRRKREEKRCYVEDIDLEDEIDQLNTIKLRTRQDILNLCRLMVRADNSNSRVMLLRLVQSSTSACKRLFMDYHGLSLLWSWMADLGYAYEHASIKIEILKTLECLPITNKTQLTDSRVLGVVERWSTQSVEVPISGSPPPPPPPRPGHMVSGSANADSDSGKKSSDTSEDSDGEMDAKPASAIIDSSSVDDVSMDSVDVEQDALKSKPSLEGCLAEDDSSDSTLSEEKKSAVEPGEGDAAATATPEDEAVSQELLILHRSMVELAIKLLEQWKDLKEYFRIPKKERIELMKEHEREVEEEIRGLDKDRKDKDNFSSPSRYRRDFDRRRRSPDREKDKERHSRRSARGDRESREDRSSDSPKMSKEQRRQLFEIQVQQEEEEAKQRKMQEEMWAMHVERCRLLGQDPYLTPIFDPSCQYYWDPNTASWQPYNGTDPNIPVPAAYGYRPSENGEGSPMIVGVPPGHVIATQPLAGHLAPDGEAATPNYDDPRIDLATIPLPGEVRQTSPTQPLPCQAVPVEGTPPQGARVLTFPVPAEPGVAMTPANTMPINLGANAVTVPFMVSEEPPPPPPGPITIQLPPRWKMARDSEGHVYFYHVKSRTSQWEPPTLEQHQQLEAGMGSDSESESTSTDSDSTSTTDSEDFSSDEEEEEEEEEVTTVERGELCDEKMIRRHRAKKPRSESLVQERVISPVLEMDKEAARRERREAKERAQKEARQERQDDRLHEASQDMSEPGDEMETISEKMQRMDRAETVVEKDRHEHRESKSKIRDKTKSKERAATAIADNSDSARKCKENFRAKMATYIVSVLNPYRRDDCKIGRITCNEDFKYLARKLTHFVMIKELKQLHSVEDLECNDSVKYKTKDFVRKYMSKYGHEFKRDPSDTKEY